MACSLVAARSYVLAVALLFATTVNSAPAAAQEIRQAPAAAPSTGRAAPPGEPGAPLHVSGVVVDAGGAPVAGASLYAFQTDHEGYYGVKPESDNRNPRLKVFLRSDERGAWAFDTVKPGSYPGSRTPAHIHFQVSATGHAPRIFEIVFESDPFVTPEMRERPDFSVRPIEGGRVTERIVLDPDGRNDN
jgi:protocatechuate 3,4-dioxygenase beta subunit